MPINLSNTGIVSKENKTSKGEKSQSLMLEYKDKAWLSGLKGVCLLVRRQIIVIQHFRIEGFFSPWEHR